MTIFAIIIGCCWKVFRHGTYNPSERLLLNDCKIDRSATTLDKKAIERVESLAKEVKDWKNGETVSIDDEINPDFPWKDVSLTILKNPDDVKFLQDSCPICDTQSLVEIYFQSPAKTWEKMCGRAGNLTICTKCKKQVSFHCTMMN